MAQDECTYVVVSNVDANGVAVPFTAEQIQCRWRIRAQEAATFADSLSQKQRVRS
jgi:hypothetical protein